MGNGIRHLASVVRDSLRFPGLFFPIAPTPALGQNRDSKELPRTPTPF